MKVKLLFIIFTYRIRIYAYRLSTALANDASVTDTYLRMDYSISSLTRRWDAALSSATQHQWRINYLISKTIEINSKSYPVTQTFYKTEQTHGTAYTQLLKDIYNCIYI